MAIEATLDADLVHVHFVSEYIQRAQSTGRKHLWADVPLFIVPCALGAPP